MLQIVSNHSTGLKSETVETKFKEMFKERLPSNWLDIIQTASLLSVEKLVSGTVVYPIMVLWSLPFNLFIEHVLIWALSNTAFRFISRQDLTGEVQNVNQLPPMILPETEHWNVLITSCLSTNQVFFRIVGDEYDVSVCGALLIFEVYSRLRRRCCLIYRVNMRY